MMGVQRIVKVAPVMCGVEQRNRIRADEIVEHGAAGIRLRPRIGGADGENLGRGDKAQQGLQTGGWVPLGDGQQRYAGNVPPVHKACAERAARLCPHLSRQYAVPVRFPKEDEGRMVARTDTPPGMEEVAAQLPRGVPVVMSCYRLHGPRFSRLVRKLRTEAGID